MKWIDHIPIAPLVVAAILFAIIPLNKPHLFEKLGMLFSGTLARPIDIFDLFMHSAPLILLCIKLLRMALNKTSKTEE